MFRFPQPSRVPALLGFAAILLTADPPAHAAADLTDDQIAQETSDPASGLWYFYTLLGSTFEGSKPFREAGAFTLEIQPSLPVPLADGWRVLNYPDLLLSTQGTPRDGFITGVESFSWMTALSPEKKFMGLTVAAGPVVSFPVSSDPAFGPAEWQFGAGGLLVHRTSSYLASALAKSLWTTSGAGGGLLQIQYNLQYFVGDGWQVGLGRPRIEYRWNARGEGTWDLPVGVDVGRVVRFGKLPVKFVLEYEFFPINDSQWMPEHMIRLMIIPVMSNPLSPPPTRPN